MRGLGRIGKRRIDMEKSRKPKKIGSKCCAKIKSFVPTWEHYKGFFHIEIFKYLVLWFSIVPILASILTGIPQPLNIDIGETSFQIAFSLPFNWKTLWVSSLFFCAAFFIYTIRCPKFIKRYNSYGEYKKFGHDQRWLSWEAKGLLNEKLEVRKFVERLSTKGFIETKPKGTTIPDKQPTVERKQTVIYFEHDGRVHALGMPVFDKNGIVPDSERGVFWEIFGRYSSSKFISRLAIVLLLLVSLGTFLSVLFQHIATGILYFAG
jgi:hypothetical protein